MAEPVSDSSEATQRFLLALQQRGIQYSSPQKVSTGDPGFYHQRILTNSGELYHLKFTKSPYKPKPTEKVSEFAKELDEKLKHSIRVFGRGEETLIGINENIVLDLVELTTQGHLAYFVTVVGDGRILWCEIERFYNFVMRYDTFFKFARANVPQAMVPTGWLLPWGELIVRPPTVIDV